MTTNNEQMSALRREAKARAEADVAGAIAILKATLDKLNEELWRPYYVTTYVEDSEGYSTEFINPEYQDGCGCLLQHMSRQPSGWRAELTAQRALQYAIPQYDPKVVAPTTELGNWNDKHTLEDVRAVTALAIQNLKLQLRR